MNEPDGAYTRRPAVKAAGLQANPEARPVLTPITNYTLSSICPNCENPTVRIACKVRCERCGFQWDCSEL